MLSIALLLYSNLILYLSHAIQIYSKAGPKLRGNDFNNLALVVAYHTGSCASPCAGFAQLALGQQK